MPERTLQEKLKKQLLNYSKRKDCVLIQAGAFVVKSRAFILSGMGTIDILEAMSQFNEVSGIIGTGNALFLSKDCTAIYSALSKPETEKRYEIETTDHLFKYAESAQIAPLIFLNRAIKSKKEFKAIKKKKNNKISFGINGHFFTEPVRFAGTNKARLRAKFVKTAQSINCPNHPPIVPKEKVFSSFHNIEKIINNFRGHFILGYATWSDQFAQSLSMVDNYKMSLKDNPSEIIGFTLLKLSQQYVNKNQTI